MNLHIFICSSLQKGAGGCEIWLEYFIKNILKLDTKRKIYIYYVKDYKNNIITFDSNRVLFEYSNKISNNGLVTVPLYTINSLIKVIQNITKRDICLFIGSTYVAFIGIFLSLYRLFFCKDILLITWIRSISIEELRVRSPWIATIMESIEKLLLNQCQIVICNGLDTFNYYKSKFNIPNIEFINNALSVNDLFLLENKILKKNIINIGFLGRYCYEKGFDKYLESIELFYKRVSENTIKREIRFHSYGYGELEKNIKSKFIVNHGRYEPSELKTILDKIEVVVFFNETGKAGGVSHSLLEAMASGRVIVAWDNIIHRQVVNNKSANFIKENDLDELNNFYYSLAMGDEMIINEIYKKTLVAKCEAEKYSPGNHVKKFLEIINKYKIYLD